MAATWPQNLESTEAGHRCLKKLHSLQEEDSEVRSDGSNCRGVEGVASPPP